MSEYTREYPYEKAMVLNAIYDTVDTIDFHIIKANSTRGTLIIATASFSQIGGRIAISHEVSKDGTVVEVFPFEMTNTSQNGFPRFLMKCNR